MLRVLDLFCGLGGFSKAFRERGHFVVGVDIVQPADVIADIRRLPIALDGWDVVLAAPPCDEFSRESMPWSRTGVVPSLYLVKAAIAVASSAKPRIFAMENVIGAKRWIGNYRQKIGSRCLWGWFPPLIVDYRCDYYGKESIGERSDRKRLRALVPYGISAALCSAAEAIERD